MATERRKPTAEKQPPGRPRHVPTQKDREIVSFASAIGTPQATIGRLIGISEHTIREHYRDELDLGMARANISVGRSLYRIATGNSPQAAPAAMFWMKTRAGWKETVRQENTGPDGGPIEFKGMSARERIESRIARIHERMEEDKNPRRAKEANQEMLEAEAERLKETAQVAARRNHTVAAIRAT